MPKFYQRFFSIETGHNYQLDLDNSDLDLVRKSIVQSAAITNLHDGDFETYLSGQESRQSRVLRGINRLRLPSYDDQKSILMQFITIQFRRTLRTFDELKLKAKHLAEQKGFKTYLDLTSQDWDKELSKLVFEMMMKGCIDIYWVGLSDLQLGILKNQTTRDFIFSDHPIIVKNHHLNSISRDSKGFQLPGIIIFLPTNRKTMLLLYDPEYYFVQNHTNSEVVKIVDKNDIDQLNTLQFYNCYQYLFSGVGDHSQKQYLLDLYNEHKIGIEKTRIYLVKSSTTNTLIRPDSDFLPDLSFVDVLNKPIEGLYRDEGIYNFLREEGRKFRDDYITNYFKNQKRRR